MKLRQQILQRQHERLFDDFEKLEAKEPLVTEIYKKLSKKHGYTPSYIQAIILNKKKHDTGKKQSNANAQMH